MVMLAAVIDASALEADFEFQIADAVRSADVEHDERTRALADAFQYYEGHNSGDRHFGPMIEFTGGTQVPPPLEDASGATLAVWEDTARLVTSPMASARLHDLLFEVRHGKVGDHATSAIRAYLARGAAGSELEQDRCLLRALELARKTANTDLAERVLTEMAAAVRRALAPPAQHGTSGRLLEALAADRDAPAELDELLDAALTCGPDPDSAEHLLLLKRRRCSGDEPAVIERRVVQLWFDAASRERGPVRVMHLERAAERARKYGHRDLLDEVTIELQKTTIEDHGLERFGMLAQLPPGAVEHLMAHFVDQPSTWLEAASLIYMGGPPSGDVDQNRAAAKQSAHNSISASIPKVKLGGDGLPRWTARTDDDMAESRLVDIETRAIGARAPLMAEVVLRLRTKLGPLRPESFDNSGQYQPHLTVGDLAAIGRALDHYGAHDWEASACIALPRVESLIRNLLLAAGNPIYRTQRASTPGQYPGLGALLASAQEVGLDESWCRFIRTFLSSGAGLNYRNEMSHGFVYQPGRAEAAMIFLCLLAICSLTLGTTESAETGESSG
jgi:hypothetical protein